MHLQRCTAGKSLICAVEEKEKKGNEAEKEGKGVKKRRRDLCTECRGRILSYDTGKSICLGCFEEKKRLEKKRDALFNSLANPGSVNTETSIPPWELMKGLTSEELRERLDRLAMGGDTGLGSLTGMTNQGGIPRLGSGTPGPQSRRASADMAPEELRAILAQVTHDSLIYKDKEGVVGSPSMLEPGTEGPTLSSSDPEDQPIGADTLPLARACADFQGSPEQGTLSFQVDDILEIVDQSNVWWVARLGDEEGLIPSNYVELIDNDDGDEFSDEEVEITIPEGAHPGSTLNVEIDGEKIEVVVPEDAVPGGTLLIRLPGSNEKGDEMKSETNIDPLQAQAEEAVSRAFDILKEGDEEDLDNAYVDMAALKSFLKYEDKALANYIDQAVKAGALDSKLQAKRPVFMRLVMSLFTMQKSDRDREGVRKMFEGYIDFYSFKKMSRRTDKKTVSKAEMAINKAAREKAEEHKRTEEKAHMETEAEAETARMIAKKEAARRGAEEEAAQRRAKEEAVAGRKAEEEASRKKAEEEAALKRFEEEAAARIKAEEETARKKAEEEVARRKAEEEAAARRKAREEAARKKAEEEAARERAEEEAAALRKAEEEAARKKAEEEAALKRVEEAAAARRAAEEKAARKKAEEEAARRKAEEEAARRRAKEEAARKRAEEEAAARRKAEEEAARKKAEEEAALRRAEEAAAAARRAAEEKAARKKAEEEAARRKAKEEAARRKAKEEAARKKAEEEAAARRKAEEEAARKKAEEEAARKKAEEEAARKRAEEAAAARRAAEEKAARKVAEEEAARRKAEQEAAARRRAEEVARRKAEVSARKKAEEEAAQKRAEEEAAARRAAEEKTAREKAEEEAARRKIKEEAALRNAEEVARKKKEAAARAEARRLKREARIAKEKEKAKKLALENEKSEQEKQRMREKMKQATEDRLRRLQARASKEKKTEESKQETIHKVRRETEDPKKKAPSVQKNTPSKKGSARILFHEIREQKVDKEKMDAIRAAKIRDAAVNKERQKKERHGKLRLNSNTPAKIRKGNNTLEQKYLQAAKKESMKRSQSAIVTKQEARARADTPSSTTSKLHSEEFDGFIIVRQPNATGSRNATPQRPRSNSVGDLSHNSGVTGSGNGAATSAYQRLQNEARRAMEKGEHKEAERLFRLAIKAAEQEKSGGGGDILGVSDAVTMTARKICEISSIWSSWQR